MRTTLHLDDDVYETARSVAAVEGASIGKIVSRLARRGLEPAPSAAARRGFPVFPVRADAAPITPDMVRRALDEE
jgi:hypothetical protein